MSPLWLLVRVASQYGFIKVIISHQLWSFKMLKCVLIIRYNFRHGSRSWPCVFEVKYLVFPQVGYNYALILIFIPLCVKVNTNMLWMLDPIILGLIGPLGPFQKLWLHRFDCHCNYLVSYIILQVTLSFTSHRSLRRNPSF